MEENWNLDIDSYPKRVQKLHGNRNPYKRYEKDDEKAPVRA